MPDNTNASSTTAARLLALFRAIHIYILSHLRGQVSPEELRKIAQAALDEIKVDLGPVAWESAQPVTVMRARSREFLHRPVRIAGHVGQIRDTQMVALPAKDGGVEHVETTCVTVEDYEQDAIETIGVTERPLIDDLRRHQKNGTGIELLAIVVTLPVRSDHRRPDHIVSVGQQGFLLHVVEVRAASSALDMLGATAEERACATDRLLTLKASGLTPLSYLVHLAVSQLGIVGLDSFPLLRDLIEYVVMQAVSLGRVGNASGRLHLLIVGPPGQSKKIPSVVASVLGVRFVALSSGNLSIPGLLGASYRTEHGWISQPGALVQAGHGIASLQDAHGLSVSDLRKIGPVLQAVIEDGQASTSKAGGGSWNVPVALIIDLNRIAHLGTRSGSAEAPLATLRPLLSRLDLIVEIPADVDRACAVATQMLESPVQDARPLDGQTWVREARLLVAALRDALPVIDIEPARAAMRDRFAALLETNRKAFESRPDAGDLPARCTVSMTRMVIASARACGRVRATDEDVERAVHFLNMKLGYLSLLPAPTDRNYQARRAAEREEWFRSRYAGATTRASSAAKEYEEDTGQPVNERTVRRFLGRVGGACDDKGNWRVPASETALTPSNDGAADPESPPTFDEKRLSVCPSVRRGALSHEHSRTTAVSAPHETPLTTPGWAAISSAGGPTAAASLCRMPASPRQSRTDGQTDNQPQPGAPNAAANDDYEAFAALYPPVEQPHTLPASVVRDALAEVCRVHGPKGVRNIFVAPLDGGTWLWAADDNRLCRVGYDWLPDAACVSIDTSDARRLLSALRADANVVYVDRTETGWTWTVGSETVTWRDAPASVPPFAAGKPFSVQFPVGAVRTAATDWRGALVLSVTSDGVVRLIGGTDLTVGVCVSHAGPLDLPETAFVVPHHDLVFLLGGLPAGATAEAMVALSPEATLTLSVTKCRNSRVAAQPVRGRRAGPGHTVRLQIVNMIACREPCDSPPAPLHESTLLERICADLAEEAGD